MATNESSKLTLSNSLIEDHAETRESVNESMLDTTFYLDQIEAKTATTSDGVCPVQQSTSDTDQTITSAVESKKTSSSEPLISKDFNLNDLEPVLVEKEALEGISKKGYPTYFKDTFISRSVVS